ncbi:ATG1 [Candida pseudojiufengensis]|uniref:ATG1 n=1 Tax=Candida pseudojiufengensis TaxID=497109 RepID=UPI0022254742|nr:ATG1 [Candida pseudojiufengensis]KAI5965848.1 ATG1 [Candida pseudojiufengensis]
MEDNNSVGNNIINNRFNNNKYNNNNTSINNKSTLPFNQINRFSSTKEGSNQPHNIIYQKNTLSNQKLIHNNNDDNNKDKIISPTSTTTTESISSNMSYNTSNSSSSKKLDTIGNYSIGPEIGKGSFAIVYKGNDLKTNKSVAIKSVYRSKLKSKKLIENLEIEISILKTMKHPHIVGLLDYKQTPAHVHLIMDYCSMGDLSYFIRKRNQLIKTHPIISSLLDRYPSPQGSHGLNEVLVLHFLKQLSSALLFLREKSLVHRDIKPQNLLLCPPLHSKIDFISLNYKGMWELPILKIADFGFARFLPSTSMAETLCGSPLYMAPEILRYEKYNAKADLWSVGAVLYEMTVGKPPFKAGNHIELLKNIEKANDVIKFPMAAQVPESLKQLIRSLLKYNPTERISFQEFFNNNLITCDLEDTDKPLETSEIDENLFISEYISPIKHNERSQLLKMTPVNEEANLEKEIIKNHETPLKEIDIPKSSRDEEIKNLINKNSPDPETLTHSINKSPSFKLKKDDVILEKDYVVVEKRAIEVNAIADELAHAGSGAGAISDPRKHTSSLNYQQQTNSQQQQQQSQNPFLQQNQRRNSNNRRPSFTDRRISISISPTNALSKAIGLASHRLFGNTQTTTSSNISNNNSSTNVTTNQENNQSFSNLISSPHFANNMLLQKLNLPNIPDPSGSDQFYSDKTNHTPDEILLIKLETIATKAHAVNLFADVKFSQLIPSPPSSDDTKAEFMNVNDILPPKIIKSISEEGVVLYVKALSLLAKGMALASEWWYDQFDSSSLNESNRLKPDANINLKINQLVQWIREKFNECLEKAEFVKLRLQESKLAINNSTIKEGDDDEDDGDNNNNKSITTTKVVAEKLLFDRALEMSRNAAVNELVKEDLHGCELSYSTAIWMLEAVLDEDDDIDNQNSNNNNNNNGENNFKKLDDEDRIMVEKFIVSIGNRLSVLKKKIEFL